MSSEQSTISASLAPSPDPGAPGRGPRVGRLLRRYFVFVVGFTVVLIGVAMLVLPGPGTLVIPIGLAILATEFVWAKHLLQRARSWLTKPARKPDANRTRRRRQKRLQRRRAHRQRFTAG